MKNSEKLRGGVLAALLLAASSLAHAGGRPERVPITAEQIATALNARGLAATSENVEMLCAVSSRFPDPALEVMTVSRISPTEAKVRMRCRHKNSCLPFLVVLHSSVAETKEKAGTAGGSVTAVSPLVNQSQITIRSGKRVTLLSESGGVRITLPVICLQNGALGQQIRVISADHKKAYVARVEGPELVTSVLIN